MRRHALHIAIGFGSYLQDIGGAVYSVGEAVEKWASNRLPIPSNASLSNSQLDAMMNGSRVHINNPRLRQAIDRRR